MGKGDRKTKAKRNQRKMAAAIAGVPELEGTPKRQPNGDLRRANDRPTDPRKTALQARVRAFGGEDTVKGRQAVSGQHMGCQIGMVIQDQCGTTEAQALWKTFAAWVAAEDRYRSRYLGQTEHAKCPSLVMVPERVETDTGHTVDIRSNAEKDAQAVSTWMRWQGHLGHLSQGLCAALHDARLDRATLWTDRAPTNRGMIALSALRALTKVSVT